MRPRSGRGCSLRTRHFRGHLAVEVGPDLPGHPRSDRVRQKGASYVTASISVMVEDEVALLDAHGDRALKRRRTEAAHRRTQRTLAFSSALPKLPIGTSALLHVLLDILPDDVADVVRGLFDKVLEASEHCDLVLNDLEAVSHSFLHGFGLRLD